MEDYSFISDVDGETFLEPENYDGRFVSLEMVFELYTDPEMEADDVARMVGVDESDIMNAVFYWTEEPGVYEELVENADVGPEAEIFAGEDDLLDDESDIEEEFEQDPDRPEDYNAEHVEYSGPVGELRDIVEDQVDQRDFQLRYKPSEENQHRSVLEMHVTTGPDAEEEAYFGADGQKLYIGSTVSESDKEFNDPEDAEQIVKQELNSLVFGSG